MPARALAAYPLFALLTSEQLAGWVRSGQEFVCATGETIFQEGTAGAWVYLVREGRVRIVRRAGDRDVALGMLQPGDVFGEYALLPPGRNTATCRAAAMTRLLRLPLAPMRSLLQAMPEVWANLKNWLRMHTLLHFRQERAFLGFMSAESGLKLLDRLRPVSLAAGQTVQATALADDCWFAIDVGEVEVQGEGVRRQGQAFGERGLAGVGEVPVAQARTAVRLQCLTRHEFAPGTRATPSQASLVLQSYQAKARSSTEYAWVPQLEEADCGLAALAMVATRRGRRTTVEELRSVLPPGPAGLTLAQLRGLASSLGLHPQAVSVAAERLNLVTLPAVAHLRDGHYVVLHEVSPTGVVVGDPAAGVVTWSLAHTARHYSGALLVLGAALARDAAGG